MKIQFHQEALREYDKALLWYAKRSVVAPINFEAEVDSMVERLMWSPTTFPIIHKMKRKAVLRRFPFALIFEFDFDKVIVYALAHSKRKTMYWRNRRMDG